MKRQIGACLFAVVLLGGCIHTPNRSNYYSNSPAPMRPIPSPAGQARLTQPMATPLASKPGWQPAPQPAAVTPPAPTPAPTAAAATPPAATPAPLVPNPPAPADQPPVIAPGHQEAQPIAAAPAPAALAVAEEPAATPGPAPVPQPLPPAPPEVEATYAHGADYSWLNGKVERVHSTKSWRLRYAGLGEEDPYGGSVTLSPDAKLNDLKEGMYVRVRGRLFNPEARTTAPAYRVEELQLGPGPR